MTFFQQFPFRYCLGEALDGGVADLGIDLLQKPEGIWVYHIYPNHCSTGINYPLMLKVSLGSFSHELTEDKRYQRLNGQSKGPAGMEQHFNIESTRKAKLRRFGDIIQIILRKLRRVRLHLLTDRKLCLQDAATRFKSWHQPEKRRSCGTGMMLYKLQ